MLKIMFIRFSLGIFGIGFAAGLALLTLQLFPDLRPGGQRFVFRDSDGDTFRHQPGFVRPPEPDRILEDFIRRKDDDGFRQARMSADHYPILALGDSFTEGGQVPWVDVLAEELDTPVRNLGWRGFGPLHELEVLRQYGSPDHDWILIAYFEGNDLSNIQTAQRQLEQTGGIAIARDADQAAGQTQDGIITAPDGNYLYPLTHLLGARRLELAYISDYLWWLNGDMETFRQSRNVALLGQAFAEFKTLASQACLALVYIPSKEHLYFPYSDPQGNRRYVLQNGLRLGLDSEDWLSFGELAPQADSEVLANLENQRLVVTAVAQEAGLQVIDLTPTFQAALPTAPPLYYTYDSHWTQDGHALAGQTIARFIEESEQCPNYR
jgi:hypothetical protein